MIRVQIVEDVALISDAIRLVLRSEPDFEVVGSAGCLAEALRQMSESDVALVNITLRDNGALYLVEHMSQLVRAPKVIIMGVSCPESELLPFLDRGIAGYVLAENSVNEFIETIRMAVRGEAILSPKLTAIVMSRLASLAQTRGWTDVIDPTTAAVKALTSRECEVIELVGRGLTNQEIADLLAIEVGTVKNHVHSILRKLDVTSRRAAAAMYSQARNQRTWPVVATVPLGSDEESGASIEQEMTPSSRLPRSGRMPA